MSSFRRSLIKAHRILLEPRFPIRMDPQEDITGSREMGAGQPQAIQETPQRPAGGQAKLWHAIQENVEEGEVDSNWGDQQVVTGKTAVELRLKGAFP